MRRIIDKVIDEMASGARRLEGVHPGVFFDAINVGEVRDGQVTNRPVYVAIGVTCGGERDILGLWAGDGGEGAKFWLAVRTELKNSSIIDGARGVDRLNGPPEAMTTGVGRALGETGGIICCGHVSIRVAEVLGQDRRGHPPGLHRAVGGRGQGTLRRVHRDVGCPVPGDHPIVGERLERARAVPGLRRRDPTRHLLDERRRILECPLPRAIRARGPSRPSRPR